VDKLQWFFGFLLVPSAKNKEFFFGFLLVAHVSNKEFFFMDMLQRTDPSQPETPSGGITGPARPVIPRYCSGGGILNPP
jgi:hypothetical protein